MTPEEKARDLIWINDPDMNRIFTNDKDVRFDLEANITQAITEAVEAEREAGSVCKIF